MKRTTVFPAMFAYLGFSFLSGCLLPKVDAITHSDAGPKSRADAAVDRSQKRDAVRGVDAGSSEDSGTPSQHERSDEPKKPAAVGGMGGSGGTGEHDSHEDGGHGGAGRAAATGGEPSRPMKADGEACSNDADCTSNHCAHDLCCANGDCCRDAGDCPSMLADGLALACNDATQCQGSGGTVACAAFRCTVKDGTPNDSACTAQTKAKDCGLYRAVFCTGAAEQSAPACATSCKRDGDCADGARCTASETCARPAANGGDCGSDADCSSGHCGNGVCCASGDCCKTADACKSHGSPARCMDASQCKGSRQDASCEDSQCKSTEVNEPTACVGAIAADCGPYADAVCATRGTPTCARACTASTQCKSGFMCSGGQCVAKLKDGASCMGNDQCEHSCNNGVCCQNTTASARCCATAADCKSLESSGCARNDNTCDGVSVTASCSANFQCVTTAKADENACKREINCGAGYVRNMPCPLGCSCTNVLDCAQGYHCDALANGRGKCVLDPTVPP